MTKPILISLAYAEDTRSKEDIQVARDSLEHYRMRGLVYTNTYEDMQKYLDKLESEEDDAEIKWGFCPHCEKTVFIGRDNTCMLCFNQDIIPKEEDDE